MIISGHKRRSIADQTGIVDFNFGLSFSNTTGQCIVGLSGTRDFKFTFKNGKIYDDAGNFVQSYAPNNPITVSGQLGQTSYDYTINGELIAMGSVIGTGKYSWLYVSPSGLTVDFNGSVRGTTPNYYAGNAGKYLYENYVVTGQLINLDPSTKFRIFNVEIQQPSSPYSIVDFTTGDIQNTGYITLSSDQVGLSDYIVPLLLRTNFGDVSLNFTVTGDYSIVPDIYLNISPDTTSVLNGVAKDYLAQFSYFPTGAYLGVELEYVSGTTGNIYFFKDQISDIQYRLLSGVIEGCARLAATHTGLVSGLDPKTSIYEQGTGTGAFVAPLNCATGEVSEDYILKVFGRGAGFFEVDYTASGFGSGIFSGVVPISGGYLTIVGYNFVGTGDSPGVAVGFVPVGTGRYFARPTGCMAISQTLTYGADFYSGTLALDKSYSGPLNISYSTVGVGWATGAFISGRVDSLYALNFEQGLYKFTKSYSGLVSGYLTNTGNFDPISCLGEELAVTGIITGNFSVTSLLECSSTVGLPMIPITGYPVFVYDSQSRAVQPNRVVLIRPSGGFGTSETSYDALLGNYTHTKTSRMGATSSGDGYFQNPVGNCSSTPSIRERIWKESMPISVTSGTFDSIGNSIGYVGTEMYLNGTGDITDPANIQDSGVMHFSISGAGKKAVALRGLNYANPDRMLKLSLYKDGFFYDSWENIYIQAGLNQYSAEASFGSEDYDTIALEELESGYYSLYVTSRSVPEPTVKFSAGIFSGCESSRYILVSVIAEGVFRGPCCVDLYDYEELTAHAGVNYDPIYLGQQQLTGVCVALDGQALSCPSICFPAASPTDGIMQYETLSYSFTIPVYDNAAFGYDHDFLMYLSHPSGCSLAFPSSTTVRILENDNPVFLVRTGEFLDQTGILSGVLYDCSPNDPVRPPPPDPCIYDASQCDPCLSDPESCDPEPPPPDCVSACCAHASTISVSGTCPGYDRIFTRTFVAPGTICGLASSAGDGATDGYVYLGDLCCSGCGSPQTDFQGACMTASVKMYPSDCLIDPETCEYIGTGLSGIAGAACVNYNAGGGRRGKPAPPKCASLLVFLQVTEDPDCPPGEEYHHCHEHPTGYPTGHPCHNPTPNGWIFSGWCSVPASAPTGLICPPRPPTS